MLETSDVNSLEFETFEEWEEEEQELTVNPEDVKGRYLTFWLDKQLYGMTIAFTEQIVGMQEIVPVPGYPFYAKGVMNMRGYSIPVIDVRLRFGMTGASYDERTCVIINKMESGCVGFIVDRMHEVIFLPEDQILPPPVQEHSSTLLGLGRNGTQTILLVDPETIFSESDVMTFGHMGW